ncbi:hypothetical protein EWM64_g159 [Hericium alpestre]|uniref:Fungal-type protein kinase domain-containing protein n=1 Tax=Hericium alpestre TaxID=135208 RepID=A0A4Z0AAQ8_9AGAM|nr:hypothetical protein EWM64_g159 [Hericium alpestre]
MKGQFIGPMPVTEFLKAFLDPAPEPLPCTGNPFESLAGKEVFEDRWVKAVTESGLCPTVDFRNTRNSPDTKLPYKTMVDMSGFAKVDNPIDATPSPPSRPIQPNASIPNSEKWTRMELPIECKPKTEDPFLDPTEKQKKHKSWNPKAHQFEKLAWLGTRPRGQITTYASAHMACQFRTFSFSICLLGEDEARLIRWDRSGAIVTERFNYTKEKNVLAEFLWRFNHLGPKARGHDLTVTPATSTEIELAKTKDYFSAAVNIHKVTVHNDADNLDYYYLVSAPTDWNLSLTGRATRGYVALDMKTKKLVWLKDSWRIDVDELEKEVDIYVLLHEKEVDHIAPLVCGGDVVGQKTITRDYINKEWCCGKVDVLPHQHCRLVLGVIGRQLQDFRSSQELCQATFDAMEGHWQAFSKADVLHRDVSGGNILIDVHGKGIIIDWDLCKKTTAPAEARRNWRTGTWRFISTAILQENGKVHKLSDDLESFLHVILYHALRYRAACASIFTLRADMEIVFESSKVGEGGRIVGGDGKRNFFSYDLFNEKILARVLPPPLAKLIAGMRMVFSDIYSAEKPWGSAEKEEKARKLLETSAHFLQLLKDNIAAEGWIADDGGIDLLAGSSASKSKKRTSPDDEDDEDTETSQHTLGLDPVPEANQ